MARKSQKKSGAQKKREKKYVPPAKREQTEDGEYAVSGAMSGMVGGFRRAVGVSSDAEIKRRKNRWVDWVWTALLVLAAAAVLFWRFG